MMCEYCHERRAGNLDHVIPRSVVKKRERECRIWPHQPMIPPELRETVGACHSCNVAKGTRLLIPASWADRLDELNALNLGTFRVWDGSAEALRIVVR